MRSTRITGLAGKEGISLDGPAGECYRANMVTQRALPCRDFLRVGSKIR